MAELKVTGEGYVEVDIDGVVKKWRGEVTMVDVSRPPVQVSAAGPWPEFAPGPFITVALTFKAEGLMDG